MYGPLLIRKTINSNTYDTSHPKLAMDAILKASVCMLTYRPGRSASYSEIEVALIIGYEI